MIANKKQTYMFFELTLLIISYPILGLTAVLVVKGSRKNVL